MDNVFWLGICDKYCLGMVTSNRSVSDMIGLVAKGVSNLDGVTPMYLWRMRDYTYEVESKACGTSAVELYEDTPFEVAVKKFENMVDKVVLM